MQWILKPKTKNTQIPGVPDIIISLLSSRGIQSASQTKKFFSPSAKDFHDPFLLSDMKKAVERILQAKEKKEKVMIYGDYDADGVTASSLLWNFLYKELGLDVSVYIPSRFDEGYGLNVEALDEITKKKIDLIITVDCGVKDKELIGKYPEIDFIVTDHHTLPDDQNFKHLVVHPKREGSKYPFEELSGAAVAWKLVAALSSKIEGKKDAYLNYLDLASIGTVCDIMPLSDENRAIVALGLKELEKTRNFGLAKLIDLVGLKDKELSAFDIGFGLGPRINAAGRLNSAMDAVKLFCTQDKAAISSLAAKLDRLNKERQEKTIELVDLAEQQITEAGQQSLYFVYGQDWHEGVIGLVAGKLTERYSRPVICATIINGTVTGSARSIKEYNITHALDKFAKLLKRHGGHAQAAGFALDKQDLETLQKALKQHAKENLGEDIESMIEIDMRLNLNQVNIDLVKWIEKLNPFGAANPVPIFEFDNMEILKVQTVGPEKRHVRLVLKSHDGKVIEAIAFSMAKDFEKIVQGDIIDLIANLKLNTWNGNTKIQLNLKDFKKSK